jgi:membrane protease YdiL (CAAX protease family)
MTDTPQRLRADWLVPLAMVFPTLGAWAYFVQLEGLDTAQPAYFGSKILQLAIPFLWILWTGRRPRGLLRRPGLGAGLLTGVVMSLSIVAIWYWTVHGSDLSSVATTRIQAKMADFRIESPISYLGMALGLSGLHSLFEEFYWRWFVYRRLQPYMPLSAAAVVSSVAFASHHVIVLASFVPPEIFWTHAAPAAAGVGFGGLVWCALLQKFKSLTTSWTSHILVDLALMGIGAVMLFF